MRRPAPRAASRRLALQVLYAGDLSRERPGRSEGPRPSFEEVFARVAEHFDVPEAARAFVKELVCGVADHREEIDALLARHARNWRLERMATVDRNVLRLAAYELVHTDTPTTVVLDQAIELARQFGDDPSPAFVNGVLDAVARSVRGES